MGGTTGARRSEFFRVMTTRSGISFGCRTSAAGTEESTPPAIFIRHNFQSGSSAPYGGGANSDAKDIVFNSKHQVDFRVQCIELISLAM